MVMISLVLGGTRSGKSAFAEATAATIAAEHGLGVRYVATAEVDPADADYVARIAAHRARRPDEWVSAECPQPCDLLAELREASEVVLVDSLGSWLVRHHDFVADGSALVGTLNERTAPTVLVSEEVGMAVHPPTALGRRYVDAMGTLNQQIAQVADRAVLVVAGRVVELGESAATRAQGRR